MNYRCFNEAVLARQGWRLMMNHHSYWRRFLKGTYFPNTSFLQASRGSHASWAWSNILHGRNLLVKGLRWQIHNGKGTDFWNDSWVPSLPNFRVPGQRTQGSEIVHVADVIDAERGTWNRQKLATEVAPEVVEAILKISLPLVDREDQLIWHFNPKGVLPCGFKSNSKPKDIVWKTKVQNKIRSFWWRACKNSLATLENLFKRKSAQSNTCPICESEIDSVEHMLFTCNWAKAIYLVWLQCPCLWGFGW